MNPDLCSVFVCKKKERNKQRKSREITMSATQSDDWYEESSPNLAATLDPNDHDLEDSTNHSDGSDETNVLFTNCSLPTPFFRLENMYICT